MEVSGLSQIQWQIGDLVRVHSYWGILVGLQWARRRICWAVIRSRWLQQHHRQLVSSRADEGSATQRKQAKAQMQ